MNDLERDRCGICPLWFGGWAMPACIWHDHAYTKGSWAMQNLTRKQVDDHFLLQLLELSKRGRCQELKVMQSYAMYLVVRAIGSTFWEGIE